jgi:hypothetical protein
MTDGNGANGDPWREVQVFYWDPGREQVRTLVLSPFARGVGEGTIRFEGESADADVDLHQTGGRRRMKLHWAFDGPDRYRETLLEATDGEDYEPLVEFDLTRTKPPATPRPRGVAGATGPSERLKALERLLGPPWEATGARLSGEPLSVRVTWEWVPLADVIVVSVVSDGNDGAPRHLVDAYVYHHTGTGRLRGLALSDSGGVYEGDARVLDDGALEIELEGHDGERATWHALRLDFEDGGTSRIRAWSLEGARRTPLIDVRAKRAGRGG